MTEEENKLYELLKTSPSLFMNQCIEKSRNGEASELCTYVQLKMLNDTGRLLSKIEKEVFNNLSVKYNHIDTSQILFEYERSKKIPDLNDVWQGLKDVLKDIRLSVRIAHEKNPNEGYSGFLSFLNELWKNINGSKSFKYDADSFRELSECYFSFKTKHYRLNESITIKLKPGILLHILVGHIKKYHIPRKGAGEMFSKVENWKELLVLFDSIILYLSNELITHYSFNKKEFDNSCFNFENCLYGIHIDKQGAIKTFYERKHIVNKSNM